MTDTVGYYNRNAARYVADTVEVDLSARRERFLAQIPAGGFILDAGCGSGRDSLAFPQQGYRVRAFDAAPEIARLATERIGQPVQVQRFDELDERADAEGRHFTDATEARLRDWLAALREIAAITPQSKRGREIIEHERLGIALHLFVRDTKLSGGKAAPFVYHGKVRYQSHTGSGPMSVIFEVGG